MSNVEMWNTLFSITLIFMFTLTVSCVIAWQYDKHQEYKTGMTALTLFTISLVIYVITAFLVLTNTLIYITPDVWVVVALIINIPLLPTLLAFRKIKKANNNGLPSEI